MSPDHPPRETAHAALRAVTTHSFQIQSLFVPGRIEFLGKHTDYAGGRSLLCTVERGFHFAFAPRTDSQIRVFHPATNTHVEFPLTANLIPTQRHWSNYLMTVARRIAQNFPAPLRGADIAFDSNLPIAAGLSSSSALIVGMFLVLSQVNALTAHPNYQAAIKTKEDLAGYLGSIENGQSFQNHNTTLAGDQGVGTLGGSQDHTAILCSIPDHLQQYNFFPVKHEAAIAFPSEYKLVIATSGIEAQKTGPAQAAYNRNPLIVRRLLELWNTTTHRNDICLAAAVRSAPDAPDRLRHAITTAHAKSPAEFSSTTLLDRLNQFLEESERIIPAAATALRTSDFTRLGELVDRSQQWAERALGNQIPQTICLAKTARQIGAVAASAFGAGFGGSVWAMVRDADAQAFQTDWLARYRQAFPVDGQSGGTFVTRAGNAASLD